MLTIQMYSDTNYGLFIEEVEQRWGDYMHWDSNPITRKVVVPHEVVEKDECFSELVRDLGGEILYH